MLIAVGGFQHETNTFSAQSADWPAFRDPNGWPGFTRGDAVFDVMSGLNLPLAGFVARAARLGHALAPLSWCAAQPSGRVTDGAFERIAAALLDDLAAAGPVDAVYLDLHGAMATESHDDGEGELLRRVRALVGPAAPIAVSLDLHANLTPELAACADVVAIYRTYPHVDFADTGARAADRLHAILKGAARPQVVVRHAPFLVPLTAQGTDYEPCRGLYAALPALERETGAALDLAMGFPPADIHWCGPAAVAAAPDRAVAEAAAERLIGLVAAAEPRFDAETLPADAAVAAALRLAAAGTRPVVIADTQDNPGAGGTGDTTGLLRAAAAADASGAVLGLMQDPDAAAAAHAVGIGGELELALGGRATPGDAPFRGRFVVRALSDGRFRGSGPMLEGAAIELGPMAALEHAGVLVVVASRRTQPMTRAVFTHLGIDLAAAPIIVVKSSVHFRADFAPIAGRILVARAPGLNPADPGALPYRRLRPGVRRTLTRSAGR